MDDDWGPIPLSRLSHAGFCLRRAALLTNEQIWEESAEMFSAADWIPFTAVSIPGTI
mgnify:CR=1 FL=1